jgi:polyisoprenoid-binding protein YceI
MRRLATALLLALLAVAAHAQPARYDIDPEHFSVGFLVEHIGYARVLGLFEKASGSYTFDEAAAALSDVRIVIESASIHTAHRRRDQHLRSADFLNASEYPQMIYTATAARRTGDRTFEIDGQLQLLGRTQPVQLRATWNKSARYELPGTRAYVMGVSARGTFRRSAFGMKYGVDNGWVGDDVELILEFEARRQ